MSEPLLITEESVSEAIAVALDAITRAETLSALKAARSAHVGEASTLAKLNASMRLVPHDQKAAAGKLVGSARARVNQAFTVREDELAAMEEAARLREESVDVTAIASHWRAGARHPLNQLMEHIGDIFVGMGWEIDEGPEVEHEWFNFDALNTDADHPARGMQDTLFITPAEHNLVLRSQTSNVQIRGMLGRGAPLYIVAPGKVMRRDELDATHTPVFHQVEGIAIDKGLTMAHLRGTLEHFARIMFGQEARIRLRPSFFPFTEPSAELDVWHPGAKGGPRWVEWGGCGMVNRNVLLAAGVDPEEYQGFAFGMGIERTLMFRNELQDMRDMVEGDVRFGAQFGMVV